MATYNWGVDRSYTAAIDFSTCGQYRFMVAGSVAGECTVATVNGASYLGVLQNDPKAAEEATVRVFGFTKVLAATDDAASPMTYGGFVKTGSSGKAKGYLGATACTFAAGMLNETAYATGSGAYVEIFLFPCGMYRG